MPETAIFTNGTYESAAQGSAAASHIISGPLVEIGVKNGNGWGIPESEAEAVIAGLQGVPLKICTGAEAIANEHACDYNWDPKAEIGKIVGAEKVGNWIHAKAQVTDLVASDKIRSSTWAKRWSIFTGFASKEEGMLKNTKPLAVTLVRNPAYPGAGYTGAGGNGVTKDYTDEEIGKMLDWMKSNPSKITENHKRMMYEVQNQKDRQQWMKDMLAEMKKTPGMVDADMVAMMKDIAKAGAAQASASEITLILGQIKGNPTILTDEMRATVLEIAHASKRKEGEYKEGTMAEKEYTKEDLEIAVAAAIEKEKVAASKVLEGMIPKTEAEKLASAAADKSRAAVVEETKIEALSNEIAEKQVSAGIIKPEEAEGIKKELMKKGAAALESDLAMLNKIFDKLQVKAVSAAGKFRAAKLPGDTSPAAAGLETAIEKLNKKYKGAA